MSSSLSSESPSLAAERRRWELFLRSHSNGFPLVFTQARERNHTSARAGRTLDDEREGKAANIQRRFGRQTTIAEHLTYEDTDVCILRSTAHLDVCTNKSSSLAKGRCVIDFG